MKLQADRATLMKALAHVQSVVERRNTIPILANVMIAVRDGKLTLTATDMEIAIVEDVPPAPPATAPAPRRPRHCTKSSAGCPTARRWSWIIPAATRNWRCAPAATRPAWWCCRSRTFPSMTAGTLPHRFSLSAQTLRGLIDRTRFAISTEETRYYLNGIYLHAADSEGTRVLRAVATDGHRLARVEEPLPEGAGSMPGVIIPRKTVNELRKLLDEVTGNVEIALSDTRIQFRADRCC